MNGNGFMLSRRKALLGGSIAGTALFAHLATARSVPNPAKFAAPPRQLKNVEHDIVYRREDEFSGWPHTSGFWNLGGGELLQNFITIATDYGSANAISHDNIGRGSGGEMRMVTVRSRDYGRSWSAPVYNAYDALDPDMRDAASLEDIGPLDFLDPRLLVANNSSDFGTPEGRSAVRISKDGGRRWSPPFDLPLDGLHSLSAINSTTIRPDGRALLFLIEVDETGWVRHPLVYGSMDDGRGFHFISRITPRQDPMGQAAGDWQSSYRFGGHRWFYPRGYMLPSGRILCVLRSQRDPTGVMWSEVWNSDDGGRTWGFLSRINDFGAPTSLVPMPDGRVVAVYGYRLAPQGIRARVSDDGGESWGGELIIRDDGGSWDLGYPNAWAMEDGKIGVLYYFNSRNDPKQVNGGVRHIARSIFSVD
ncbi:sialidase family protein [Altericroceibacterium endophyticum]|uniref:Sialidase domain-containing protein n=1 Tax=Altericroceibacterium endophyticum TaxID=1808508 RepID=A0A6I4TAT6_9SPHN|nr:sialidase family protein [Altericroceibacterium endophyticum]MXO67093.1 hypothetical protein [Altericroceibacterium endophyticum]